jgi:3-deoxy-manno-octulosonate cytidylyltransferase (CMP-KDO synthetase)
MRTAVVIPARLESTRFPEKMLAKVTKEHSLIQRVHHWCCCFHDKEDVYVATDSKKIASLFPGKAIMTSQDCVNGTDRVAEAARELDYDNFINVQGDMVDVPHVFDMLIGRLLNYDVATVYTHMNDKQRQDPNSVKLVHNLMTAQWFARGITGYGDWHLGVYAYKKSALMAYNHLTVYEPEMAESLEQLRWLQNGYQIGVVHTSDPCAEINTKEDLLNWQLTHQN